MCGRLRWRFPCAFWALAVFLTCFAAQELPASPARPAQTATAPLQSISALQGKLVVTRSEELRLSTSSGDVPVTSNNPQLLHTLQDARLRGREVRLEGQRSSRGEFNVSHIFIVRDGKLYRLRYYCHVCNIPATEPGPCVCCQRPTELEEIPVDQVTQDMVLVP